MTNPPSTPIPAGNYVVKLIKADKSLATFEVTDGDRKGARVSISTRGFPRFSITVEHVDGLKSEGRTGNIVRLGCP